MHLGVRNIKANYLLGGAELGKSQMEKDYAALVDNRLVILSPVSLKYSYFSSVFLQENSSSHLIFISNELNLMESALRKLRVLVFVILLLFTLFLPRKFMP